MCVYINVYVSTMHSSSIKLSAFRDRSLATRSYDRIGDEDGIHFKDAVADQGVRSRERRLAGLRRANQTVLHSP